MRVRMTHGIPYLLGACAVLMGPAAAWAAEGVIQINQQRVTQGSITAGDTGGFPATISVSGSYRLTSDLEVTNENTTGIDITANNVTLDLNGFRIHGPTSCAGHPTFGCTTTGTGQGVSSSTDDVVVVNGTVEGVGSHGVRAVGRGSRIERVHARSNGGHGLTVGESGSVRNCLATNNGGTGINVGNFARVESSSASGNDSHGMFAFSGNIVASVASENQVDGINGSFVVVVDSQTTDNIDDGIDFASGGVAVGNVSRNNGGRGISCSGVAGGCNVVDNVLTDNTGAGFHSGIDASYKGNLIDNNVGGTVTGGVAVQIGTNACNGNTTCP